MKTKYIAGVLSIIIAIFTILLLIFSMPVVAEEEYVLANNEQVVKTFDDLKTALTINNGKTTIYFGDNIVMTSGIAIHSSKTNVIISGLNPQESNQTTPYTLTDVSSTAQSATINIGNNGVKSLLVSDLNIVGKNWYGPFSVYDLVSTTDLVITYQRVRYSGPTIGYHRMGLIRFIDCYANINGNNGGSSNQEFAEAKYLRFEGVNRIETSSAAWAVFWHTNLTTASPGAFEVADNSALTVIANDLNISTASYGIFAGLNGNVNINIGENALFDVETSGTMNGLGSISSAYFTSFTVNNGGEFNLKTTKSASTAIFQMNGNLSIGDKARFKIDGYGDTGSAMFIQRDGNITVGKDAIFHLITERRYLSALRLVGMTLFCYDPESVLVYNAEGRTIDALSLAGKIHVEAEQINNWNAPDAYDSPPLYSWKKADKSNFIIDGTLAVGANNNFSALTSNFESEDAPGIAPSPTTFNIFSARVVSFGRLGVIVYEIDEYADAIEGVTTPGATVLVQYKGEGDVWETLPDVTADSDGHYSVPLNSIFTKDTAIVVNSYYNYLNAKTSTYVEPIGTVNLFVPDSISFEETGISTSEQLVRRSTDFQNIAVEDTRGIGSGWRVFARLIEPLTSTDESGEVLDGALVFIDRDGVMSTLNTDDHLLIEQHTVTSENDHELTELNWLRDRGILARIPPDALLRREYTGSIEWILYDTP